MLLNGTVLVVPWNHLRLVDPANRSQLASVQGRSVVMQAIFVALGRAMAAALWPLGLKRLRSPVIWPLRRCAGLHIVFPHSREAAARA